MILYQMVQNKKTRPAGRPREFDDAKALHRATDVFRAVGFDGASMADLAQGMGLNKPSIYGAFGNKLSLYQQCCAQYAQDLREMLRQATALSATPRQAFEDLLNAMADFLTGHADGVSGCLIISTLPAAAGDDPELQALLDRFFAAADSDQQAWFEERFGPQLASGPVTPAHLAILSNATLFNLSLRSRAGNDRAALDQLIRETLAGLEPVFAACAVSEPAG